MSWSRRFAARLLPRFAASGVSSLLLAGALACGGAGSTAGGKGSGVPVFVISVDTLRADHLPAYGYRGVATPNLDALRRDSVLFQNAYSHVPLTLASHAAILTGRLPQDNGIRDNYGYSLSPKVQTLASFLKARGYATGAAISAAVLARGSGLEQGFDFYDDDVHRDGREERDGSKTEAALEAWLAGRQAAAATAPVFAFLHIFEPHTPYEPPEPYRSRYPGSPYDGEIARADEIVGTWIAKLKTAGLYDRALVIFLSDHGEGLGDHGEREHGVLLYREAIHVPLFVKYPANRNGGGTVAPAVGLVDLFPTIARAAGMEPPAGLTGVPLEDAHAPERAIYSETLYPRLRLGWSDLASLVDSAHHYIEAPRPELYDVVADPGERKDLAPGLPPAFRSLRLALSRIPRSYTAPSGAEDPERARQLASLGYLTATSPDAGAARLPDPKDVIGLLDARHDFAALLAKKNDAELIAACREFVARVPGALDVWRMLADALERKGDHAGAVAALESGLRGAAATGNPAIRDLALERLATLLVRAGRRDEALKVAATVTLKDAESLNAIGVAQAESGDLPAARGSFEKAVAADPADGPARLNLGMLLLQSGDAAGARSHLEEAVRLEPGSPAAWETLGQARAESGDAVGARAAWAKALEIDPGRYRALFNLGIAAGRSGDMAAAATALRRFVAEAPPRTFQAELSESRRLLAGMQQQQGRSRRP
jgi:arylsulfatase A-like enzyme/tetratricopeptide (TPR) repeat protein